MKLICTALLLTLIASPVYAQDQVSGIAERVKAYQDTYNRGDMDSFGQLFAEDAKAYPPGSDVVEGRDAIVKLWQSYQKDFTDMKLQSVESRQLGEMAYEIGRFTGKYQGKPDEGKYMTIWKNDNGTWRVYRDFWN